MRLQCHDSRTLFHISQPPSYRCPEIQTHHPHVSLPAVIAVHHHSTSSTHRHYKSSTLSIYVIIAANHQFQATHNYVVTTSATSRLHRQLSTGLQNIASSSYTNISTITSNCYLPHAGLLITDCRTIPRRITTTDTTPSVQANIIAATISSPALFYCLQLTSRPACKSHALQLHRRASCHESPCYRSPSCLLAGEYCSTLATEKPSPAM